MSRSVLVQFDDALHKAIRLHGVATGQTLSALLAQGARLVLAQAGDATADTVGPVEVTKHGRQP